MATTTNQYEITLGVATTTTTQFQIVAPGAQGSPAALRTLLHPDPGSPLLTYQRNSDRIINFSTVPLAVPNGDTKKTQGTTLPFLNANSVSDVLITEIWLAPRGQASTTGAFMRRLYELFINPPSFVPGAETFVIWSPNDLVDDGRQWNCVIMDLRVGGRSLKLDVKEHGADLAALADLDTVKTGLLDKPMELDLLLRSQVV